MLNDNVVRQFAIDIERLQRQCKANAACNIIFGIGLTLCGIELFLLERDSKQNTEEKEEAE